MSLRKLHDKQSKYAKIMRTSLSIMLFGTCAFPIITALESLPTGGASFIKGAQAQYFIRKKSEDKTTETEKTNAEDSLPPTRNNTGFIVRPKSTTQAIEKREINPLYVRKKPIITNNKNTASTKTAPQKQPSAAPSLPEIDIQALYAEIQTEITSTLGECKQKDRELMGLVNAAFGEATDQANAYAQDVAKDNALSAFNREDIKGFLEEYQKTGKLPEDLPETNFQDMLDEYQKTGEAPDELKAMLERQPKEMLNTFQVLHDNVDFEKYMNAAVRCIDYSTMHQTAP